MTSGDRTEQSAETWSERKPTYKYRHSKSVHGHDEDVLISAVQKYVRRGNEPMAVYAALELDRFAELPAARALVTRFANRLRVTLLEEIGLAAYWELCEWRNRIVDYMDNRESWTRDERQRKLASVVAELARARKIRLVSDVKAVFFTEKCAALARARPRLRALLCAPDDDECNVDALPSPHARTVCQSMLGKVSADVRDELRDTIVALTRAVYEKSERGFYWLARLVRGGVDMRVQLDACVKRRRASTHAFDLMLELGTLYTNQRLQTCTPEELPCVRYEQRLLAALVDDYRHFRNGHRDAIVWQISVGLLLFRAHERAPCQQLQFSLPESASNSLDDAPNGNESGAVWCSRAIAELMRCARTFDDFVYDQHTRAGRALQRGPMHFAQHGARVAHECVELLDSDYRAVFLGNKQLQQREKDAGYAKKRSRDAVDEEPASKVQRCAV